MSRRVALAAVIFTCIPLLAGCCCARAETPLVADAPAEAPGRQVFIDATTVRIPETKVAAILGELRPTDEARHQELTEEQAKALLGRWQTDDTVRVLQAPKLLALEGQESTISIGETIRFAKTVATDGDFVIQEDPHSPVFVGYRLWMTATPDEAGEQIAIQLHETARQMKREMRKDELAGMDGKAFLERFVLEQDLELAFGVADGGYVLIGSPDVHEDNDGRFLRVSIVRVQLLDESEASTKQIQ